jgi:hypothetical protein
VAHFQQKWLLLYALGGESSRVMRKLWGYFIPVGKEAIELCKFLAELEMRVVLVSLQRIYQRLSVGITANIECQVETKGIASDTADRVGVNSDVWCRSLRACSSRGGLPKPEKLNRGLPGGLNTDQPVDDPMWWSKTGVD